jgi:hypothetical protein
MASRLLDSSEFQIILPPPVGKFPPGHADRARIRIVHDHHLLKQQVADPRISPENKWRSITPACSPHMWMKPPANRCRCKSLWGSPTPIEAWDERFEDSIAADAIVGL